MTASKNHETISEIPADERREEDQQIELATSDERAVEVNQIPILLVEDDPAHRLLCQRSLEKQQLGYTVEAVATGNEALVRIQSDPDHYKLILLDYVLPDCTGLELLEQFIKLAPQAPIVMITGHDNDEFAVMSLRAGASDYLPKTANYYANLPRVIQTNLERQRLRDEVHQYQLQLTEKVRELEHATEQLRRMNSLLDRAHSERLKELSHLQQIYRVFNYATDIKRICRRLNEYTAKLVCAQYSSLALYDERTNEIIAQTSSYDMEDAGAPKHHYRLEEQSAAARVLETGEFFLSNNLPNDPYYQSRPELKSMLVVPLKRYQRITGFLFAVNKTVEEGFIDEDVRILSIIANQVAIGLENARLFEQLRHFATTDELSGLANRRHFMEHLDLEIRRSQRNSRPFTLMLIDLDKLKFINDKFGHQAGDSAIKRIADVLMKNARSVDLAARLGGDEFAVLLPETGKQRAQMVAERLCRSVAGTPVELVGNITISVGYATYPFDSDNAKDLIKRADEALYIAKREGRNRAVAYQTVNAA